MTIHFRQAVEATLALIRRPFDFPASMRLVHAVGDLWILRAAYARLVRGLSPPQIAHLQELTDRPVDPARLLGLPPSSLGHHLAVFMRDNHLSWTPQTDAWPPMAETLARDWVLRRFARVHDVHHTLLGFRLDPPGELGLQVFNFRNFHEPFGLMALLSTPLSIRAYGRARAHLAEVVRGWREGAHVAENLLHFPFEEHLADDIEALRARFGIEPPPGGFQAAMVTPPADRSDGGVSYRHPDAPPAPAVDAPSLSAPPASPNDPRARARVRWN